MSEALNDLFVENFQKDPTLTWQYFGSSTGFFRLYPGMCVTHTSLTSHALFFICRGGVVQQPNMRLTQQLPVQENVGQT